MSILSLKDYLIDKISEEYTYSGENNILFNNTGINIQKYLEEERNKIKTVKTVKTAKTAIVTGCPGQDAYYLCQLLLKKGYNVVGTYRYSSTNLQTRFAGYPPENENNNDSSSSSSSIKYVCCDITDPSGVNMLISQYKPDEVYNLAAASHVGESFKNPSSVFPINCGAVINWLEAIRNLSPETRFYQANTSELFGSNHSSYAVFYTKSDKRENIVEKYQCEDTPFSPNSPYATAKLAAHNMVRIYRDSYGIFACAGILFNHGSPRRGENFVTRKITKWIGEFISWRDKYKNKEIPYSFSFDDDNIIATDLWVEGIGLTEHKFPKLRLGNVDSIRDWSHAADMVRGMYLMLRQENPDDFVLASEIGHSVRDFLKLAFLEVGITDYENYFVIDAEFFRPCEVPYLRGSAKKAKEILNWEPQISFQQLVKEMVESDLKK